MTWPAQTALASPYSPEVARAVERAWSIAVRRGSTKLEMIDLLVALLQSDRGRWSEVLEKCEVDVDELRRDAEAALRDRRAPPSPPAQGAPYRPRCLSVGLWAALRAAWEEARRLRHGRVGLPHLLFPLLEGHSLQGALRACLEKLPATEHAHELRFDGLARHALERAHRMAIGLDEVPADALLLAALLVDELEQQRVLPCPPEELVAWRRSLWEEVCRPHLPWGTQGAQAKDLFCGTLDAFCLANRLARDDRKGFIGPHHVVKALLLLPDTPATRLATSLGLHTGVVQDDAARPTVADIRGDPVRLSASTVKLVAMAAEEAFALQAGEVGEDHLLLALMRVGEDLALRSLDSVGLTLPVARVAALELTLARRGGGDADASR